MMKRSERGAMQSRAQVTRARRGFTLMEIMIAITITALVATVAAASLRAGIDARERVVEHRQTIDAEARVTSWLGAMLRHPASASAVNEALFAIGQTANGNATATFMSQGVETPAGTGGIWRVSLEVQQDGLHILAIPAGVGRGRVPLETVLPHVRSLDVRALESSNANGGGQASSWRTDWPVLRSMPSAVRITLDDKTPIVFPVSPLTVSAR